MIKILSAILTILFVSVTPLHAATEDSASQAPACEISFNKANNVITTQLEKSGGGGYLALKNDEVEKLVKAIEEKFKSPRPWGKTSVDTLIVVVPNAAPDLADLFFFGNECFVSQTRLPVDVLKKLLAGDKETI